MKKISLFLLALICSVATSWGKWVADTKTSVATATTFTSPWTESSEGSIEYLFDNDASTYWHSAWGSTTGGQAVNTNPGTNYFVVADVEGTLAGGLAISITRRAADNDHAVKFAVYGTNDAYDATADKGYGEDGASWTKLGILYTPYVSNTETVISNGIHYTGSYKYYKFVCTRTNPIANNRGYFHMAEFCLYTAKDDGTTYDYTVSGGDAIYNSKTYTDGSSFTLDDILDDDNLSAAAVEGYVSTASFDYANSAVKITKVKEIVKVGTPYLIKNKAAGAYVNTKTLVGNEVSLQSDGTPLYFTANSDGTWKINEAADNTGKYINVWWWYVTPGSATNWTIVETSTEGEYRLKTSYGYLAPNSAGVGVALWGDKAADHSYGIFTIEKYDITTVEAALSNAIAAAKAQIGTNPGYYKKSDVTPLTDAAETALADESRTIATLKTAQSTLTTGMAALTPIMPEEGKTYQIVSALPGFEAQQKVKKAMYANGTTLSWKSLDSNDRTMYWTLVPVEGGYAMVNVSTGTYAGVQVTQSSAYPMSSDATVATLTFLGSAQFTIKTTGSGYAMHTGGHSSGAGVSGNVVAWDGSANSGSAWYIVEAEAPSKATITYVTEDGKFNKSYEAAIGGAYPTPEANYMIVFSGVPTGTVTADETVTLTYTTRYDIATSAETVAKWYAIDIHGNQANYPLYSDGSYVRNPYNSSKGVDASVYQNGRANSPYAWAFVGDAFTGIKLYNRDSKSYAVQENDADEKIKMGAEGTVFQICQTTGTGAFANTFALKAEGRSYYFNQRDDYVQGWTAADGGSALRAYEITPVDKVDVNLFIRHELGCATFVSPFEIGDLPADIKVYTTEDAGTWVKLNEIEDGVVPAGKPVVLYGATDEDAEINYNDYPTTTETAPEDGVLVGNLAAKTETVYVPATKYVLQCNNNVTGWYQVNAEKTIKIGTNRCYMKGLSEINARAFYGMSFDGEATGINSIATEAATKADGKYLVNGKIVVVKAGKAYNMGGQEVK